MLQNTLQFLFADDSEITNKPTTHTSAAYRTLGIQHCTINYTLWVPFPLGGIRVCRKGGMSDGAVGHQKASADCSNIHK